MSRESAFIARLSAIARDPAARGLADDCAVLPMGDRDLVLTHDMLVEGVHYLPDDPPEDVAWKLVAMNLSDLAAKGARPIGVLMGYALGPNEAWDARFARGLDEALGDVPLLGGDTVKTDGPRCLGLTAIGEVKPGGAPSRNGAKAGDSLWVTGSIGNAGLGLEVALGKRAPDDVLLDFYRRPTALIAQGMILAPLVHAMSDVSDGLLIDAKRMAKASNVSVTIDLASVPYGYAVTDRLAAVTSGDDYELLFAAPADFIPPSDPLLNATKIGVFADGAGVQLLDRGQTVPMPPKLGYEH